MAQPACSNNTSDEIRYIALGDSYTAGTGASPEESWPVLLTKRLQDKGVRLRLVANLARSGWTTKDVIEKQLPVYKSAQPSLASILIGANDLVRGGSPKIYRQELAFLLDQMLAVLPDRRKLFVVTIPDYSITPAGQEFAAAVDVSAGLRAFNKIIYEEARRRNLVVIDIYDLSQRMAQDPSLISADNLHPSAQEYAIWAERISHAVYEMLQ